MRYSCLSQGLAQWLLSVYLKFFYLGHYFVVFKFSSVGILNLVSLMCIQLISGRSGYDYKSVRRWTSERKLGYSLRECDKVSCFMCSIY